MAVQGWHGNVSEQAWKSMGVLVFAFLFCVIIIGILGSLLSISAPSNIDKHKLDQILILSIVVSLIGYPVLQYIALHRLSGIWRQIAVLPLLVVVITLFMGAIKIQWLELLVLEGPITCLYLATLLFIKKFLTAKSER